MRVAANLLSLWLWASPVVAVAQTAPPVPEELLLRRQEALLLHRRIDLATLRVLRGGAFVASEPPLSRLLLVHLWAVECKPCLEELPTLQRFFGAQSQDPRVKVVMASETRDSTKLVEFIKQHRGWFPNGELYQVVDDGLRSSLQNFAQPLTLLVDERGIVHQAFVGSLRSRKSELVDAVARYLKAL
jgi:thiol-disulfide isomerase/thioredoxin